MIKSLEEEIQMVNEINEYKNHLNLRCRYKHKKDWFNDRDYKLHNDYWTAFRRLEKLKKQLAELKKGATLCNYQHSKRK